MLKIDQFIRRYCVRRSGDFDSVTDLGKMEELPLASVLHINDNFDTINNVPVPDMNSLFMTRMPPQKRLTPSSMDAGTTDLIKPDMKGITVIGQGLKSAFMDYQQRNKNLKLILDMQKLPEVATYQSIVSYNHLHSVRLVGKFQQKRLFDYIVAMMLNNVMQLPRHHILTFPVQPLELTTADFNRVYEDPDPVKMSYPNSMTYLLLMNLMMYVKPGCTSSIFDKLPEAVQQKTYVSLYAGTKGVFYNLGLLKELSNNSAALGRKLLAQFSELTSVANIQLTGSVPNTVDTPKTDRYRQLRTDTGIVVDKKIITEDDGELLSNLSKEYKSPKLVAIVDKVINGEQVEVTPEIKELLDKAIGSLHGSEKNVAAFSGVPAADDEAMADIQRKELDERDQQAINRINANDRLTPAQKRKAVLAVTAYKTIDVSFGDGSTLSLEKLLLTPPATDVDENRLDNLEGEIRDPSMLNSSIVDLDDQYMRKQFKRDLARMITSFEGMHPVDVKVARTDDMLNRLDTYTITFVDENLQQNTVNFTLPVIDKNGRCRVNGIDKQMSKQRINNPICKVSPSRVTLNSNFNKTIVDRYGATAYSFYPRVSRILDGGKAKVTYRGVYPFDTMLEIAFHDDELERATKEYAAGLPIYKVCVGEDYVRWKDNLSTHHVKSKIGDLMVLDKTVVKNLEEYPYSSKLTAAQKKTIKESDNTVVIRFLPQPSSVVLSYYYTQMAERITDIRDAGTYFTFDYYNRYQSAAPIPLEQLHKLEQSFGVYIGWYKKKTTRCFMDLDGMITLFDMGVNAPIDTVMLLDLLYDITGAQPKPFNEWLELKILNKSVPVGFALCYRFGLTAMLGYLDADFRVYDSSTRINPKPPTSAVILKFSDKTVVIATPTSVQRMIFSGLNYYKLSEFFREDMDNKDVYYEMMESKGLSVNYLKGVDTFFEMFVDPQTRDVLIQMNEPTNVRDILIRCAVLLMSEDYNSPASVANTRIRTYDRLVGVAYNELSQAYATYKTGAIGASDKFSVNPQAVYQRLIADQLMDNVDRVNPVQDFKSRTTISHTGFGGRGEETFMIKDRQFTEDALGVISEATVDSRKVGMTVQASVNPNIRTLSGLALGKPPEEVTPAELLSITGLLIPGTTHDD